MKDLTILQNNYCAFSRTGGNCYSNEGYYTMGEKLYGKRTQAMILETSLKLSTGDVPTLLLFGKESFAETLELSCVVGKYFDPQDTLRPMPRHSSTKKLSSHVSLSLSPLKRKRMSEELKLSDIYEPHENDVLMGRGGKNNQHVGNEQLRVIARGRCNDYQSASKKGKSLVSRALVQIVREMKPPGRFLRKETKTNKWEDVGNDIAREKTSQVLRDAVVFQSPKETTDVGGKSTMVGSSVVGDRAIRRRRDDADDERDYSACVRQSDYREVRSPNYSMNHPYLSLRAQASCMSLQSTPCHLPVTPASTIDARKRPRYYESPLPSYQSTPNHYLNTPAHPLGVVLSPPLRTQVHRPSVAYYAAGPTYSSSFHALHSPRSSTTHSHYVPSSTRPTADPLLPDEPTPGQGDFDLFNGELLSDHLGRDGALSPFAYADL